MSESVIICAIICITIVIVIWIGSSFLSLLSRIIKGDIEPKSEDESDKIKYMMYGEALQNDICNQRCYRCAWNVKNDIIMEEKKDV